MIPQNTVCMHAHAHICLYIYMSVGNDKANRLNITGKSEERIHRCSLYSFCVNWKLFPNKK